MVRGANGGWGPTGVGGAECLVSNHNTASHTSRYSDTPVAGEWFSPLPDPVFYRSPPCGWAEPYTNRELTIFSSEPTLGLDMGHFGGLRTAV